MEFFNVEYDKAVNAYIIAPKSLAANGTYLVKAETKLEADHVYAQMTADILRPITPITNPERFEQLGFVGNTPVYKYI